jgi:hypothetical protein
MTNTKTKANGAAKHAPKQQDNSLIKWTTRMAVALLFFTFCRWLDTIKVCFISGFVQVNLR